MILLPQKTLYLHIGHYKTGSSAIQAHLSAHAAELADLGWLYPACARPGNNPTNHGQLSLSLAREHGFAPPPWYGEQIGPDEAFAALHAEIAASPLDRVIVSSEEFVQLALCADPAAALRALRLHLAEYDVRVLFYVREPMSLLKSWYNEVNKGPSGTANFPTFARHVKADFLAQKAIADRFGATFGAGAMRLMTYGLVGSAHIAAFLRAADCPAEPPAETPLVNEAQPIEALELRRLAKARKHGRADPGLSRIGSVAGYLGRFAAISAGYDELAARTGQPQPSRLGASAIVEHYADLLRALPAQQHDQREADNLRDLALAAEAQDLAFAHALMAAAAVIRPNGPKIVSKLADYRAALGLDPSGAPPDPAPRSGHVG